MLIDISPTISSQTAVWPGDTPFSQRFLCRIDQGANIDLSTMQTTVHIGAHCDAPSHYRAGLDSIEKRDLSFYYGPCQIMTVNVERGQRIYPTDLQTEIIAPRVLFHTNSFPNPNHFNTDFNALSSELVAYAYDRGVRLIGLDTPSVDLFSCKALESHQAIADRDMAVLEGVVLEGVEDGLYVLMAFPLKIEGADASPVRAILLKEKLGLL
jgi:arylformamidase